MPTRNESANICPQNDATASTDCMETHSAEMQEIIGRMPHWLISWGISLIFIVIAILLAGSWYFSYPDVVTATMTLTTQNPPVDVVSPAGGRLQHILVNNGKAVANGEYLGALENIAHLPHVLELKKMLLQFEELIDSFEPARSINLRRQLNLGEIQNSYEIFLKKQADYLEYLKLSPKDSRRKNKLQLELKLSFNTLREAVGRWESKFVLKSPAAGTISFARFWNNNRNVMAGDKVFIVRPEETGEWLGQLLLPARNFVKVKIEQKVRVKLDGFPFMEFGFIWGKIRSISLLPVDSDYMLEIYFPWGLNTSMGKSLKLHHGMSGQAEIITANRRLLERVMSPLKLLLERESK